MTHEEIKVGQEARKEELMKKEMSIIQESPEELDQESERKIIDFEDEGLPKAEKMANEAGLEVDKETSNELMEVSQEAKTVQNELLAEIAGGRESESIENNDQLTTEANETHMPFKGLKKVESEHTGFHEIRDNSKFVLRKEKFALNGITHEGLTTEKTTDQLVKTKAMFSQLSEKYEVPVLKFDYIIGEDPNKKGAPALYTFEEKVKGDSLDKIKLFEKNDLEKIDKAYVGILNQLSDSFESGEPFWIDAEQSQFILGIRDGETEKQPYIADPEPRIAHFKNLKNPENFLLERVYSLLQDIEDIESRANGTKLDNSRETIKKVFAKIPVPGPEDTYFGEKILPAYEDVAKRLE